MKFEVDFMLGKLARTLRMLGFDAKYVSIKSKGECLSNSHTELQGAMKEDRILLTRAHNLPKTETIFVVESEHLEAQLKELDVKFNIKSNVHPFTRCIICNTLLTAVDKSQAKGKVPFYVYQTQESFAYCKGCDRCYWKGTHYQSMVDRIKKMVDFL